MTKYLRLVYLYGKNAFTCGIVQNDLYIVAIEIFGCSFCPPLDFIIRTPRIFFWYVILQSVFQHLAKVSSLLSSLMSVNTA